MICVIGDATNASRARSHVDVFDNDVEAYNRGVKVDGYLHLILHKLGR